MAESFQSVSLITDEEERTNGNSIHWHKEDILILPLLRAHGNPIGLISVDAPRDNLRPDLPIIETLEMFANLALQAIESQQHLQVLEQDVAAMEQQLGQFTDSQQHLPQLIQKEKEHTRIIHDLTQLVQRIHAGLGIVDVINRQPDRLSVFSSLGREILSRMGMDIILVVEPTQGGPQLIFMEGEIPEGANPEALLGQRNPLHTSLQDQRK
jgi:hypothetical protein